ncbi:MAG: SDR family NAD(P)-dependent oxidoreductase, partial [Alphaproteobacteria bacterium]
MDLKLKGKVALITGAGSGMGQHMAIEFAKEGAKIAVNDVNKDGIAETIKQVQAAGGEAMDAGCDITDFEAA